MLRKQMTPVPFPTRMEAHQAIFERAEHWMYNLAEWVKLIVEAAGVLVITWGIIFSLYHYGREIFGSKDADYIPLRLSLARYLVVALEFQLAADILGTAIAPGWNEIGQLAAIAIIRTVLNYFLEKEMETEVEAMDSGKREKMDRRMEEASNNNDDDERPRASAPAP